MKKLEREELLKVIGILAEAEGYDLLTMNKYGSNPSSIAVLCSETGVEHAPVDMDAVGRPKEPPLESPSEPYVSLSTHTAPSPTDGNIPNFQCANKFLSLLAIAPSQCSALLLVFFFL